VKRQGRSAGKLSRLAIGIASGVAPKALLKRLRPVELEYLCEVCATLNELHLCDDDDFDFDNEEEED
jgi:hypothetical protein